MTELDKIDAVLNLLAKREKVLTNYNISEGLKEGYSHWVNSEWFDRDLMNILLKLKSDKYISLGDTTGMNIPDDVEVYLITFEGRLFSQIGGYRGRYQESILAARRVRISQTLTWILAVGVTAPFVKDLIEVIKTYYPSMSKTVVDYVAPFLCSLFLLWLLYTILKEVHIQMNKKK